MIGDVLGDVLALHGLPTLLLIAGLGLLTSAVHGATGLAGGFLLSAALAPIVGVKAIVPLISVALLISHGSRALLNFPHIHPGALLAISIPAIPCIIVVGLLYRDMPAAGIALLLGTVIAASIPVRRWARHRQIRAGRNTLHVAGAVYGGLSGASIGPGMILVPFLLGYGLSRQAFVATLAVVALNTNITRVAVFGGTNLLDPPTLALGVLVGLVTIPGNWIGRSVLRAMTNEHHSAIIDALTLLGAANFFWLAWRAL